jgi:2-polyprenyl-3-methyl-5-hydroxy-6-metoxy-1,4-benzoquinol methylase
MTPSPAAGAACQLCREGKLSLLFAGNIGSGNLVRFSQYAVYGDIYRCGGCGFVVEAKSHETEAIIEMLNAENYGGDKIDQLSLEEKSSAYAPLVNIIQRHRAISGAQLFDAGANTGIFLNLARSLGAVPFGLEPSLDAIAVAKSRFGLDVQNGVIAEMEQPDGAFDIVTLWDVIEHLYDPVADLAALRPKLKPGGYIFVSTHDIENLFCRVLGKRNPLLMYADFYHFSPRTLARALEAAGYETVGFSYFHKSWSVRYLLALFDEFWPGSIAAKCAHGAAAAISPFGPLGRLRIRFPLNLFFVAVARRPA